MPYPFNNSKNDIAKYTFLNFLNDDDLSIVEKVCKNWHQLVSEKSYWEVKLKNISNYFSESEHPKITYRKIIGFIKSNDLQSSIASKKENAKILLQTPILYPKLEISLIGFIAQNYSDLINIISLSDDLSDKLIDYIREFIDEDESPISTKEHRFIEFSKYMISIESIQDFFKKTDVNAIQAAYMNNRFYKGY